MRSHEPQKKAPRRESRVVEALEEQINIARRGGDLKGLEDAITECILLGEGYKYINNDDQVRIAEAIWLLDKRQYLPERVTQLKKIFIEAIEGRVLLKKGEGYERKRNLSELHSLNKLFIEVSFQDNCKEMRERRMELVTKIGALLRKLRYPNQPLSIEGYLSIKRLLPYLDGSDSATQTLLGEFKALQSAAARKLEARIKQQKTKQEVSETKEEVEEAELRASKKRGAKEKKTKKKKSRPAKRPRPSSGSPDEFPQPVVNSDDTDPTALLPQTVSPAPNGTLLQQARYNLVSCWLQQVCSNHDAPQAGLDSSLNPDPGPDSDSDSSDSDSDSCDSDSNSSDSGFDSEPIEGQRQAAKFSNGFFPTTTTTSTTRAASEASPKPGDYHNTTADSQSDSDSDSEEVQFTTSSSLLDLWSPPRKNGPARS